MTPGQLVDTLQLMDSFFPVGAFAYSDGLETAAANALVHDSGSLGLWIDNFLAAVFVPCEGLALLKCFRAMEAGDWQSIRDLDEELTALKPAAAVRASSRSVGRRLWSMYSSIVPVGAKSSLMESLPGFNAPIVYGIVLFDRGLEGSAAVSAFGYTRLAGIVSAGLRLIAIGQQQGQALLTNALRRLPSAVDTILKTEAEPLRPFGPFMDIQQMNHRYVYSRLFRS